MELAAFLELTSQRLPTVDELTSACEGLGIRFARGQKGEPVLRAGSDVTEEAKLFAKLLKREPWRSRVVETKVAQADTEEVKAAKPPEGATIVMVDENARPCKYDECHMWTWVGANRWYYAKDGMP